MNNYKEGWLNFMRRSIENRKKVNKAAREISKWKRANKGISKLEDTQVFADIEKKATEGMALVKKKAEEIKEKLRAKNNK